MTLLLIILFLLAPLAEIYVLLTAGAAFGALPVLAACVATAVAGGAILRWQGLSALTKARADLAAGAPPVEPAVDGVFLIVAAPLLMTPGFITDAFGFALLVPPIRRAIARTVLRRLKAKIDSGEARVFIRRL